MPYKNPERKRQWEREHVQQRNAKRRKARLDIRSGQPESMRQTPDPASGDPPSTEWNILAGIASLVLVVGMIVFGVRVARFARNSNSLKA